MSQARQRREAIHEADLSRGMAGLGRGQAGERGQTARQGQSQATTAILTQALQTTFIHEGFGTQGAAGAAGENPWHKLVPIDLFPPLFWLLCLFLLLFLF